jgi:DNA-binding PadR family transcriptional regulator
VAVRKRFVDRKPRSTYRLTERGRAAFTRHVAALKSLLDL